MHSRPKISVIIPVYNTDVFLEECILSVLRQGVEGIEIILVDDGSTDTCPQLIHSYAEKYDNIISVHQENKGQGVARNTGLLHATGEFIAFVDSDDVLPVDAYKEMYDVAVQYNSDIVIGAIQSFNQVKTWVNAQVHKKYLDETVFTTDTEHAPYLLEDVSCCNRLIRHELITKNSLCFPAAYREDLDFAARLYLFSARISILSKIVYCYRGRVGSDTGTVKLSYFQEWLDVLNGLSDFFIFCGKEHLFSFVLRSEMKKMVVKSRFEKLAKSMEYPERQQIFRLLSTVAQQLTTEEISGNGFFSLREQVRIYLLQQKEYACLEMFAREPWSLSHLEFIENAQSYQKISKPLLRIYHHKISKLGKERKLNIRVRFPRFLRCYELVSKPLKPWRAAWKRKQKAKIPMLPLLYYFILYPIVYLQKYVTPDKPVWLLDERLSQAAEDNGFFLFRYLRTKYPDLKVYYVLNPSSIHWENVTKLGQVIPQFSISHAYFLLQAKVLLSTDSLRSLAFPAEVFRRLWGRTHNVFLQHGVMFVHKTIYSCRNYFYFSQIIVSSSGEKQNFEKDYGFPEKSISTTGLARFDNLVKNQGMAKKRQILVAPTWRLGLKTQAQVKASKYYWAWMQLLVSSELTNLLNQYQATLLFRPHQNILPLISAGLEDSERIQIQSDFAVPMFQLTKQSDMLITDHSSIMFDFFYQDKPSICYMFDRKEVEYAKGGKPHLDFDADLPADIHDTVGGVLESLERYLKNDFTMSVEQKAKVNKFFKYRDNKNCERIYHSILQRIS